MVGAVCCGGTLLVTTPNVTYVPDIVQGIVTVRLRQNFRYGITDPLQWPQVYTQRFRYMAAVPLPIPPPHPHAFMWAHPLPSNFMPLTGTSVSDLGFLDKKFVDVLADLAGQLSERVRAHQVANPADQCEELLWHELAMRQALDRLRNMASTFLDQRLQVSELQRHWILATAYLRFHALCARPSSPDPCLQPVVGAWT